MTMHCCGYSVVVCMVLLSVFTMNLKKTRDPASLVCNNSSYGLNHYYDNHSCDKLSFMPLSQSKFHIKGIVSAVYSHWTGAVDWNGGMEW